MPRQKRWLAPSAYNTAVCAHKQYVRYINGNRIVVGFACVVAGLSPENVRASTRYSGCSTSGGLGTHELQVVGDLRGGAEQTGASSWKQ